MINTNVQMATMLQTDSNTLLTFNKNVGLLNLCMTEVLLKYIKPEKITSVLIKDLELKKLFENKLSEMEKPSASEEKKPVNDRPTYYS